MLKKILLITVVLFIAGIVFLFTYTPALSERHGQVQARLFVGDSTNQPLIVGFGGGGGGNDWERDYMKEKRDELLKRGYAVLALGYFNTGGDTPDHLDRISLDAISDTIMSIASRHPDIDEGKIALIGGSKGGELILNLASRFKEYGAVIAMSTSHATFPAVTWAANTSSWQYKGEDVVFVPAPFETIGPALKGDLHTAFSIMLEDEEAVKKAEIAVENINGPILIMSATGDEAWPATEMSNRIMERLEKKGFQHDYEHIVLEGGHTEPLNHFDKVYDFLGRTFRKK